MFDLFKARINQGHQTIPDVRKAIPPAPFRGLPVIESVACPAGCRECLDVCSVEAIRTDPFGIDLKRCLQCPDCISVCPVGKIRFDTDVRISATDPDSMIITMENKRPKIEPSKYRMFRNSLKLRQVSAAGCNACELELNALSNVNFDMGRFGIDFVASPRHADGVVITGPISENMAYATIDTIKATPDPKIIVLIGPCAMSGGPFQRSAALSREFLKELKVDLYIGGCPPHPLTVVNAILDLLGRK